MKKYLLALTATTLLFTACSKKDGTTPEDKNDPLSGLLAGIYSPADTSRLQYNDDKTLAKITYTWNRTLSSGSGVETGGFYPLPC
ncbi:hypothetical protein [Chitinophaga sp. HK235]|uniref:hypothetical protein n=1 Tax=Chitinophaga sp. HK235 TaxID=2952571 RepID=UPI001BAD49E0|nr:hypothetical protein [Chitinophaga sp. HK235]